MNAARYLRGRVRSLEALRYPLGMNPNELQRLAQRASSLYFVATTQPKADGTLRILYDTRQPLKSVLQRVNAHFLRKVVYPPYLTGGVPKKDYTNSVQIHAGASTVVTEDISKFYPSVGFDVVRGIWSGFFGFSDDVADLLAALTTRDGHLEQGAPTSGYLANLALWDVEPALISQLASMGVSRYSRHVDDITLSSLDPLGPYRIDWAVRTVSKALAGKGLKLHPGKHQVMHAGEQIRVLKLVGNMKPSLPPEERSRVRALVHRYCQRVESEDGLEELSALLPRIRGQAHKVKRFHPRIGARLIADVEQAAQQLQQRMAKPLTP